MENQTFKKIHQQWGKAVNDLKSKPLSGFF